MELLSSVICDFSEDPRERGKEGKREREKERKRNRSPEVKKERNGRRKGEREVRKEKGNKEGVYVCMCVCEREDFAETPAKQPVVTWSWQTGLCPSCRQNRFHREHPCDLPQQAGLCQFSR